MKALSIALLAVLLLATSAVADDEPEGEGKEAKQEEKREREEAKDEEKEAKRQEKEDQNEGGAEGGAQNETESGGEASNEQARAGENPSNGSESENVLLVRACELIANHVGDPSVPKSQWIIVDPQGCVRETVRKLVERPIFGLGR